MMLLAALVLAAAPTASGQADTSDEATIVANCNARKFETVVQVTVAGKPHPSRVKLCGQIGQTDADWARTLQDAVDKVAANPKMPATVKEQIIAALNIEIAKLPAASDSIPVPVPLTGLARLAPAPPIAASPSVGAPAEYSALPSLPPPPIAESPSLGGPVQYSALPPLPSPKPAPTLALAANAPPSLPAPRLTFRCLATNTLAGEGPCDLLERGMLLTVRADEALPGGTSLRFLRRGDNRAEVDLPALRRGQTQRFTLPPHLCAGVAGSRVEIQVVRATGGSVQVVDTRGPFELRC